MLDNNLYFTILLVLCLALPFIASHIYIKRLLNRTSDIDIIKNHYNKNKRILTIIELTFVGYLLIRALMTIFFKSINFPFTETNTYLLMIIVTIGFFFAFNKRNLSVKILKK